MILRSKVVLAGIALCGLCVITAAADQPARIAADAAYQQSFDQWKSGLLEDLKQEWLPLAGLFWLKPGENSFGADPKNAVVFPKGPAHAGSFTLEGKTVTARFAPGDNATVAGKPASTLELQPDTTGDPTIVEMGSLRFHVIVRGQRVGIRLKDLQSDAIRQYREPAFFPLDLSYRVTATWLPSDGKQTVDVPTVLGDVIPTPIAGTAVFEINGQELRLTDLGGDAAKQLFFVFSDPTSKTSTYPGGRFLKAGPVTNGTVVLDFNRAYNPPCAITPYATCPLAPKENRLSVSITAGEEYDHKNAHH
ncbi:MAG TPA: DUF1684 domain-containing protein [Terriglobales bacterium]|jgi:hypothetical protein|nr:DUF1684 domain-containing protein [Terriglobales bacterium]